MKSIAVMVQTPTIEKNEIIERLWHRLRELGLDPSDLNKKLNKSGAWVYNYLHGKRKFKRAQIEEIALGLTCNPDWLQFGDKYPKELKAGNVLQFSNKNFKDDKNSDSGIEKPYPNVKIAACKLAFILPWPTVHNWKEIMQQAMQDSTYEKAAINDKYNSDCFLLEIINESMLPTFKKGDQIVIDPHKKPKFGSFVIVRLVEAKDNILAQYFEKDGKIILRFSNPLYPEILKDNDEMQIKVIGVVRQKNATEEFE